MSTEDRLEQKKRDLGVEDAIAEKSVKVLDDNGLLRVGGHLCAIAPAGLGALAFSSPPLPAGYCK